VLRSQLLSAMGGTSDPQLDQRMRELAFEEGLLRRNEMFPAVGGQAGEEATRPALRKWIDANFEELEDRLSPAGAAIVSLYAAGMCSDDEADALEAKYSERMADVEGGPRQLKQTVESIRMCAANVEARKGQPLDF
jgi:alanyl aminopeptidase